MTEDNSIPEARRRGRGAASNATGRFERHAREAADDGWDLPEDAPRIATEISEERPRTVIARNASPDIGFDRSLNPYRGCEHGCIYCFARPTHAWLGLSPGLDFETRLVARPTAPERLSGELAAKGYRPAPLALGSNTDPWQPAERDRAITRRVLQVLAEHDHPVTATTKSALIERDADILGGMGQRGLARAAVSLTTLDAGLARRLEPRVPAPARRLAAIRKLAEAGCPVSVMVAPVIPGLTDDGIERVLAAAAEAGAAHAGWVMLRLPREVSPLFREWLAEHVPARAERVMARVREMHGGQDYSADWGHRMRGEGRHAEMIAARFRLATRRLGLDRPLPALRSDLFRVPARPGDQLSLF